MVAFLDVDTFLQRGDLELLRELKWPWEVTHFAKAAKCVNCGFLTLSAAPKHFVVLNNEKIVMLLQPKYRYPYYDENGKGKLLYGYGGPELYQYKSYSPLEGIH